MPEPAVARSSTATDPGVSLVRPKAVEAPITPAPTMRTSGAPAVMCPPSTGQTPGSSLRTPAPAAPAQLCEHPASGVQAGGAGHTAPGMRAGAAQVQPVYRGGVPSPPGHRPHMKQLVDPDVAMEDVALGQRVSPLEVERSEHLPCDYRARHVRGRLGDPRQDLVAKLVGAPVPVTLREAVRHVLHKAGHHVPAFRGKRAVDVRGDHAVHEELG